MMMVEKIRTAFVSSSEKNVIKTPKLTMMAIMKISVYEVIYEKPRVKSSAGKYLEKMAPITWMGFEELTIPSTITMITKPATEERNVSSVLNALKEKAESSLPLTKNIIPAKKGRRTNPVISTYILRAIMIPDKIQDTIFPSFAGTAKLRAKTAAIIKKNEMVLEFKVRAS